MAFNLKTFQTRALTSVVFVIVMMAGLLWNEWSYFILFSIIHFGCWIEFQKLVEKFNPDYKNIDPFHRYGVMIAGWMMLCFFTNSELRIGNVFLTDMSWWLGLVLIILIPLIQFVKAKSLSLINIGYSITGLIYISLSLALMVNLRNRWIEEDASLNMTIPLLIIFTLWVNDTMAYIVGSLIGKTPLSPVSPKKTWEGTIGGMILAIVVMCLVAYFTGRLSLVHTSIIAAITCVTGTFGDLFESRLKRMAGVKDSGAIMPGHGGFLDRFDSLLFAATASWLYVALFLPSSFIM